MEKRSRGRPREYDRETALNQAMHVFSTKGFSATAVDDLAEATGMNRPSLYNAFGNKESLYRETLDHFVSGLRGEVRRRVEAEPDLKKALMAFYKGALEEYFSMKPARGCFVFCTAPVESITHPEFQRDIKALIDELDALWEAKFATAKASGKYTSITDAGMSAKLAQSVLHSLAIRARAGESKASLLRLATSAADIMSNGRHPI
jgi:AcrR family transcriptional regulator